MSYSEIHVRGFFFVSLSEKILFHVDPLLGNDPELSNYKTAVAK
jgi:hypothetical protein